MTGVIINNNFYDISTGSTKIEYNSMGNGTLSYSMYGENIPEVPADKLLEWINIPQNISRSHQGYGYYSVDIDYCINTEYYHEFRCSPKLGPNAATAYKNEIIFLLTKEVTDYPSASFVRLNLARINGSYRNNYIDYLIEFSSSIYASDSFWRRYTKKNANVIPYDTWNSIGIYKNTFVINDNKYEGTNEGGQSYKATLNTDSSTLFSSRKNSEGFEGKFAYFNVYEDDTKTNLLHSYKPFLTPENEIIIKDVVTNKRFSFYRNSNSGDMQYITYQIA